MDRTETEEFHALAGRKNRISLVLTMAIMGVYFGFIFLIAFRKDLVGAKLTENMTWGIPLGIGVIGVSWLLTGIYVTWANRTYDVLVAELRRKWGEVMRETLIGQANPLAIAFFLVFVAATLAITWWAAKRTRSTSEFYAAGRSVTGFQNGLALAGDYMSAASFLGIAGLVATKGFDGLIYSVGWLVGWPVVLFLIAEPLRNLGKYTFADVVAYRLSVKPVRTAAAAGSIVTVLVYLIAQMVGAGTLIKLMFGLPYEAAVVAVGTLMVAYVLFGGMLATTWVQIIKAVLLLGGATALVVMVLARFGFDYGALFAAATEKYGETMLQPGGLVSNPLDTISLGLALMFGTAGLPHILQRFYTVPNAKEARKSVFYATGFIGYFYILTFTIGFGAAVLVGQDLIRSIDKGGNMAAPLLAEVLGGNVFLGFLAAVAFATILAVVAGLTLAGASALSHDLYAGVLKHGRSTEKEEVKVAKAATLGLGILAILLGILFKDQNVAFMVGLAFAIAASANFPSLLLAIFWKRFTTAGAVAGMATGLVLAVVLIVLSPTLWVDILGNPEAVFPLKNPGIFSMSGGFLAALLVSWATREPAAEEKFAEQRLRSYVGVGAE